jgi:hypothetical protein
MRGTGWIMPFSSFPYFNQISDRFTQTDSSGRDARVSHPWILHMLAIFRKWKSLSISGPSIYSYTAAFSSSMTVAD